METQTPMKTLLAGMAVGVLMISPGLRADENFNKPPDPCESTNCYVESITTNACGEGSVVLTNAVISPGTNVCVGTGMQTWCERLEFGGTNVISMTCTNDCGEACTNNCPPSVTNILSPTIISTSWEVTGVSVWPTNYGLCEGIGCLTTPAFVPINCGDGTVTFRAKWQHVCDTNLDNVALSKAFKVKCPDMTVPSLSASCGDISGGVATYCFSGCSGVSLYWWEDVTWTEEGCGEYTRVTNTEPVLLSAGCTTDHIEINRPPADILAACNSTNCFEERSQTITLLIMPSGTSEMISTSCTYNNTQTIAIAQTNSNPAHGYVVVSVAGSAINCRVTNTWSEARQCNW
jgi:hypothetical protein